MQEYFVYFKLFTADLWRKRTVKARSRNCVVLPLFFRATPILYDGRGLGAMNNAVKMSRGFHGLPCVFRPVQQTKNLPPSGRRSLLFRNMFHALRQHGFHMAVRQRIEDGLPVPAAFDQPPLLEDPKLMGYGALIHVDQLRKIADAKLMLAEAPENFPPVWHRQRA